MKIKTALKISSLITTALALTLAVLLSYFSVQVRSEMRKNAFADQIVQGTTDLVLIANQYVAHHYPNREQQWTSKFDSLLKLAIEKGDEPTFASKLEAFNRYFSKLVQEYKKNRSKIEDAPDEELSASRYLKERLADQMGLESQEILSRAFVISAESQSKVNELLFLSDLLLRLFAAALIMTTITASLLTWRKITLPLSKLVTSADIIRRGNLDHKIATNGSGLLFKKPDEITDLAQAFSAMKEQLVSSITGLEKEVTERKKIEGSLRDSEERFRATFEQAAVGIAQVGIDGRWLRFNQKFCDIVGYPPEELGELTFQEITHPDDLETDMEYVQQLMAGQNKTCSLEKRYICKDGSSVWVNVTGSLVRGPAGEPKYFIAIIEDIDQRKQAQKAVQKALAETEEARDKIDAILKSVRDGLIVTDLDNRIILMNPSAERILGVRFHKISGQPVDVFITDESLIEHLRAVRTEAQDEALTELTLPGEEKNGVLNFQAKSSVVTGKNNIKAGIITVLRDVSKARALDRMKSEFISTAAHELRTPLTSVKGFTEVLLNQEQYGITDPEKQKELLTSIYVKAGRLERIISDLLDLSRIQSGQVPLLEKAPLELSELIHQVVDHYRRVSNRHNYEVLLPEETFPARKQNSGHRSDNRQPFSGFHRG